MRGLSVFIAAGALLAAMPAAAQSWTGINTGVPASPGAPGIAGMGKVRSDISNGRSSGQLTRREARQLRRQSDYIDTLEARYASDDISDAERAELETRINLLRDDVIAKRSGVRK